MAKIKWQEATYLKCEISVSPQSSPEYKFICIDDDGNEFEITTPEFSFDAAAASGGNILRSGNEIRRVGRTSISWSQGRVNYIGNTSILWSNGRLSRIGNTSINWSGDRITYIGNTSIIWSSSNISRVGRASISPNGDISGSVK